MSTEIEIGLIPRGRPAYSQVEYSALDRVTVEQALMDYVKANFPQQKDFTESTGFNIITREIAYVADLLSYRADYLANNNYLPSATNLRALDNLLALIGYTRSSVQAAICDVVIVPKTTVGNTAIPAESGKTVRIPARTTIAGVGKDGGSVSFELFAGPTNIFDDIEIPAGQPNVTAYAAEGISRTFSVKGTGERFQRIILPESNILAETIRINIGIYDPTDSNAGTTYNPNIPEWEKVNYYVLHKAENVFEVKLQPDGNTVISFGDGTFGNIPGKDIDIIINYRRGGGDAGNILAGSLNGSGNFPVYDGGLRTAQSIGCAMTNVSRGVGGRDEESIEEAKFLAPLVYQAQNRAVKDIDYTAFALNHPQVSKAVAVSRQPIIVDSFTDPTSWAFPLASTQKYTISFTLHNFNDKTAKEYFANITVPSASYTDLDTLIIDLNKALGWTYDADSMAFVPTVMNEQFIAHFDKAIEGYLELWIETGDYRCRVDLKASGNSLLPILGIPYGGYGRVDANYVDLHVLTYADDGNVAVPNAALVNTLRTYFEQYKEIQTEVVVRRGFIKRMDILGNVFVDKTADPVQVKYKVQSAILALFDPKSRELGEPFYVSKLFKAIEGVEGVAYVDEFKPAQNIFPDSMTLIQLGNLDITLYEAKK